MKRPEQLALAFDVDPPTEDAPTGRGATILHFANRQRREEERSLNELYDRIIDSVRHIDVTRGRRMAEARERATYTL